MLPRLGAAGTICFLVAPPVHFPPSHPFDVNIVNTAPVGILQLSTRLNGCGRLGGGGEYASGAS